MKKKFLVLDAANTLIHKPDSWGIWQKILGEEGFDVAELEIKRAHKQVSEIILFPDRTDADFYHRFNAKVMFNLGIIPKERILNNLFSSLSYLPWVAFEDVHVLKEFAIPKIIASNFRSDLSEILERLLPMTFNKFLISELLKVGKPSLDFYRAVVDNLGVLPGEILYVGDSLELDISPANEIGISTCLIDRDNFFPNFPDRIRSFEELSNYLDKS